MANRKQSVQKAIDDTPERFKLSEAGYLGLNVYNGITQDELKKELNFPYSVNTFKQMSYHGTINSALTLFDNLISKADWKFKAPKDATEEELRQARIINEMMTLKLMKLRIQKSVFGIKLCHDCVAKRM